MPASSGSGSLSSNGNEDEFPVAVRDYDSWRECRPTKSFPSPSVRRGAGGGDKFAQVSAPQAPTMDSGPPGRRAATIAAAWCARELGQPYAQLAWRLLADAARHGLMRHGSPEAWAASGIILIARANHLLRSGGGSVSAERVADDLGVSLGVLASTQRELARTLNLARYLYRPPNTDDGDQHVRSLGSYTVDGFAYGRRRNSSAEDARQRPGGAP